MAVVIGARYEQTKSELVNLIRERKIPVKEFRAENQSCYFCGNPIIGKMKMLVEMSEIRDIKLEDHYFLDSECYEKSSYSMYLNGMWFPLH